MPIALLVAVSYLVNPQAWREADWWVFAILGLFFAMTLMLPIFVTRRCRLELDREGTHVHMLLRNETYHWVSWGSTSAQCHRACHRGPPLLCSA